MFTLCFVNTKIFKMCISKYYYWFHRQECLLGIANEILSVLLVQFSSSVMSDSLQPHGLQHARPLSLSITKSQSLLKLMSIESVMLSNHLTLCHPLLLPPSNFPSIRVFSNVSCLHQVAKLLEFQLQHQSLQ